MPSSASASTKTPRLDIPAGGLRFVTKDMLRRVLRSLGRQMGIDIHIDGATSSSTGDGHLNFKVTPSDANIYPFHCPAATDGSVASAVIAGTVNGVTVTNLSLTISNSGTQYVYFDVSYTQGLSSNGYVQGFSGAITCALATGSSIPSDTSTHLYRQVATYVDGVKTVQAILTSMEVAARDNGTGGVTTAIWTRA